MTGLARTGAVLLTLFGGLSAGVMWAITVDRLLVWNRMPVTEYATDFRRCVKHVDPMMPIFICLAAAGAILFALERSGTASALAWLALSCYVVIMIASITIAEPVNAQFRRLPEGTPPERAEHHRVFWRRFHRIRTVLAVAAFALSIAAILVD